MHRLVFSAVLALVAALFAPLPGYPGDCCPGPDLTVFYTSDTRGMLRRCGCSEGQMGGLSARASYIKANGPAGRTVVLDAGDTFFQGLEVVPERRDFYALKAAALARAMSVSGYDAAAVGEYDLAYGPDFLLDASQAMDFPLLCANAAWPSDGHERPFAGSAVVEAGPVKVGVVGVLGSGFPYRDFKANFGGIDVSDPVKAAKKEIEALRDKVDLVVVLSHLSVESAAVLAGELEGADIVVQGHTDEHMEAPVITGGTLLVKGYLSGKHMGRLDLWLEHDPDLIEAGVRLAGFEFSVVTLDEAVPPDDEVESVISEYRRKLRERMFVFDEPVPDGAGGFAGAAVCKTCHTDAYANWSVTSHAHAFSTLETTSDQYDPECLPCHTTGYGSATGYRTGGGRDFVNVSCESCHGRGSGHVSAKSGRAVDWDPDTVSRPVPEDVCMRCHDEENSPYFDYELYLEMGGAHLGAQGE